MAGKIGKVGVLSVVDRALIELRAAVLQAADGDFLGNEANLAQTLGVSAPTFRQAARILEHEQLLVIKRGVGGGYFVRRPGLDAAVHVAAMALRAEPSTRRQAYEVAAPNLLWAIRLATQCKDKSLRNELKRFADPAHPLSADVHAEAAFLDLVGRMSENTALILILRILYNDFGHAVTPHISHVPDAFVTTRRDLARAILERDEAQALAQAQLRGQLLRDLELIPSGSDKPAAKPTRAARRRTVGAGLKA